MKPRVCAALTVLCVLAAAPSFGHHSFSSEFDTAKVVLLTGTLTKVDWGNPHVYLYVDVKRVDGAVERWIVEIAPPGDLIRRGLTQQRLAGGPSVRVKGSPDRKGTPLRLGGTTLTLPDGFEVVDLDQWMPSLK